MPNRRQELLSRLKTTLAIVSQQTGFDSERPAGETSHQWSLRDPRLRKHEASNEGSAEASEQPGGSKGDVTVPQSTSSGSSTMAQPSTLYQRKFDEIQDEDEFLYGSSGPESTGRHHGGAQGGSRQERRLDDDPAVRLQWAAQKQARPEEPPPWTGSVEAHQLSSFESQRPISFDGRQPTSYESHQPSSYEERQPSSFEAYEPSYGDPQPTSQHVSDPRRMGNVELTQIGQTFDQSQQQWMQPMSQRGDSYSSWGGASQQNLRYSDVSDQQLLGGRTNETAAAPANAGLQAEMGAGRLRDINAGMLEGILKLVATRTVAGAPSQQPAPMPPQQQQQQQPVYESRQIYESSYPQSMYSSQPPENRSYISPEVLPTSAIAYGQPMHYQQHIAYEYSQPAAHPQPQLQRSSDINPTLLSQLSSALLAGKIAQPASTSSQPVMAHTQRPVEQVVSGGQPMRFGLVAAGAGSHFAGNQSGDRSAVQSIVAASTPSLPSFLEKPPTATPSQYPVAQDVMGTVATSQQSATAAKAEPEKEEGGTGQRGGVDKEALSRLLNMIGCSSNVTELMQELIKKDERKTVKKEQSPAPRTLDQKDDVIPVVLSSIAPLSAPVAAAEEIKPQTVEDTDLRPSTTSVPQMPSEPAHKPDSISNDEEEKSASLIDLTEESKAEEAEAIPTVQISSLSRLQTTYDSPDPDESGEKSSSLVDDDDEWKRSTDEFLNKIYKKSGAPTSKEKSRSKSKDRPKSTKTEGKKSTPKKSQGEVKKVKDKPAAGSEVDTAEVKAERTELLRGKHEIEGALELLRKELTNLRTNKKRWLESPSSAQRDKELSRSIENERKLLDHMSQLKGAMAELNQHLERLTPEKVLWIVNNI